MSKQEKMQAFATEHQLIGRQRDLLPQVIQNVANLRGVSVETQLDTLEQNKAQSGFVAEMAKAYPIWK
jgi:prefoldin subunit 5